VILLSKRAEETIGRVHLHLTGLHPRMRKLQACRAECAHSQSFDDNALSVEDSAVTRTRKSADAVTMPTAGPESGS